MKSEQSVVQEFLYKDLTYAIIGAAMEVHRILGPTVAGRQGDKVTRSNSISSPCHPLALSPCHRGHPLPAPGQTGSALQGDRRWRVSRRLSFGSPSAPLRTRLRAGRTMPEEINRVLTDQIADPSTALHFDWAQYKRRGSGQGSGQRLLFTTERDADENRSADGSISSPRGSRRSLRREGVAKERIHFVGNVMIDTLLRHKERALALEVLGEYGLQPQGYALLTLHRPSNVDVPEVLSGILDALAEIQAHLPILFPAHPRTMRRVQEFGLEGRLALWNTDYSAGLALSSHYSRELAANEQGSEGARGISPLPLCTPAPQLFCSSAQKAAVRRAMEVRWLRVEEVKDQALAQVLQRDLDKGEAGCIVCSSVNSCPLPREFGNRQSAIANQKWRCKMSWVVVKGIYKKGVVEPLETVPYRESVEVLVLFPERIKWTGVKGIWQQIKQEIARQMPDLLSMTDDERREEFDRLSNVIAQRMPYHSLEEFERAMRRDEYGLVGY